MEWNAKAATCGALAVLVLPRRDRRWWRSTMVVRLLHLHNHSGEPLPVATTCRYQHESRAAGCRSCVTFHVGDHLTHSFVKNGHITLRTRRRCRKVATHYPRTVHRNVPGGKSEAWCHTFSPSKMADREGRSNAFYQAQKYRKDIHDQENTKQCLRDGEVLTVTFGGQCEALWLSFTALTRIEKI